MVSHTTADGALWRTQYRKIGGNGWSPSKITITKWLSFTCAMVIIGWDWNSSGPFHKGKQVEHYALLKKLTITPNLLAIKMLVSGKAIQRRLTPPLSVPVSGHSRLTKVSIALNLKVLNITRTHMQYIKQTYNT